jgi:hypothetical protein
MADEIMLSLKRIIDETILMPHSGEPEACPRCRIYAEAGVAIDAVLRSTGAVTPSGHSKENAHGPTLLPIPPQDGE